MLGVWLEAGHQHWFANAGHQEAEQRVRAQIYPRFFASHVTLYCSHVIHLYMNGDLCDVTKVARQCQVKFRCALYRIQCRAEKAMKIRGGSFFSWKKLVKH